MFLQGQSPEPYIKELNIELFLSSNELDVRRVINQRYASGYCLQSHSFDDQRAHLDRGANVAPAVHVPFGAINRAEQFDEPGQEVIEDDSRKWDWA